MKVMILVDKTILITGGTSGIGYAIANYLKAKNRVIIMGRNTKKLESLAAEGFETVTCDLGDYESIEQAVLEIENNYPELSVLFNNAGVQFNYLMTETFTPAEKIINEININLTGQILLTQHLLPLLSAAPEALVVNTTSALGAYAKPDGLVYSASKAGMRNFTQGLSDLLRNTTIKVIEFIPPVTDTSMTAGREEQKMSVELLIKKVMPQIEKQQKLATPGSIRIFLWLAARFPGLACKILSKEQNDE